MPAPPRADAWRDRIDPGLAGRAAELLDGYRALHARILDPTDISEPRRFVVFPDERSWHGLGNSQLTYMYAFLVALLTRRALIGLPFPGAERCYRLPFQAEPRDLRDATGVDLARQPAYARLLEDLARPGYYPGWAPAEAMACGDYTGLEEPRYLSLLDGRIKVYRPARGIPHAVFAAINPHHAAVLREQFGRHLLLHLARFLFRPTRAVEQAVDECRARLRGHFTVGVQLRYGRGPLDLYCWGPAAVPLFWEAAEAAAAGQPDRDWRLFLATDTGPLRARARERFGERVVTLDVPVAPDGDLFSAVVDQHALRSCDALVVTNRSTFGYMAHAAAGLRPFIVDGKLGTVSRPADSQGGLYKHGRREVECIWPWQRRALAGCSCDALSAAWELDGVERRPSRGDGLRWLLRVEGAGHVHRALYGLRRVARRLPPTIRGPIRRMLGGRGGPAAPMKGARTSP